MQYLAAFLFACCWLESTVWMHVSEAVIFSDLSRGSFRCTKINLKTLFSYALCLGWKYQLLLHIPWNRKQCSLPWTVILLIMEQRNSEYLCGVMHYLWCNLYGYRKLLRLLYLGLFFVSMREKDKLPLKKLHCVL